MENFSSPVSCPLIASPLDKLCGKVLHFEHDPVSSAQLSVRVRKLLAEGGSCYVYLVQRIGQKSSKKQNKELLALKVTPLHSQHKYSQSLSEANLLRNLSHQSIVNFYGDSLARQQSHVRSGIHLLLVEYCLGGTLFDVIAAMRRPYSAFKSQPMLTSKYSRTLPQRAGSIFSIFNGSKHKDSSQNNHFYINSIHLQRITTILQQVSSALAYLHSQSIIHFDVKLENILLVNPLALPSFCHSNGKDTTITVKLCDLGSAHSGATIPLNTAAQRQMTADLISNSTTPLYKAPECVDSFPCKFIDQKVDVWAFGCVAYQLMFYQHVWDDYLGISSNANFTRLSTRKINKVFGMKITQSRHFNGASATSAATATFSPATPNLAILSGRYHLPPLHPVVPLVLPNVEDKLLFNSYESLLNMIRHKMLVVQPLKRSTMEEINKDIQQLLNSLNYDDLSKIPEKMSANKNLDTISEDDTLQTSASGDGVEKNMRLTANGSLKSDPSSPYFTLQPWAENTTPTYLSANNNGSSESSSVVVRYPSEIEVVSLNSNKKSTLVEVG